VIFIPAGQPPHKLDYPVSASEHRCAMTLLGTISNPAFEVSRIEIDREGPSYAVDTLRRLKEQYGPDAELYFILGADEALYLPKWHEAESLPGLARFIAAPRPGFDLGELSAVLPERLLAAIDVLPMQPIHISSTDLRARVASGQSIRYLVPEPVEAYISKMGLYSGRP
jgi:nicotinate-nucleotide adenylyltransferase